MSPFDPTDLIGQILINVLANAPAKIAADALDWYKRRVSGLSFAVFGYRAAGKTTLIRRMRGLPVVANASAPTGSLEQVPEFDFVIIGGREVTIKRMFDPPGEEKSWPDWRKVLHESKPKGIIFVIDHERPEDHRKALRHVLNIIKPQDERPKKSVALLGKRAPPNDSKDVRSFLLLVNKCDIWEHDTTLGAILAPYENEIREIEELILNSGGRFFARACSAKYGTHFEEVMPDFVIGIMHSRSKNRK